VAWQCLFIHIFMGGVMLEVVRTELGAMKKKGVRLLLVDSNIADGHGGVIY